MTGRYVWGGSGAGGFDSTTLAEYAMRRSNMRIGSYAKTIVAAVLAAAYALQAAITDDVVTNTEWVGIGLAVLTVLGVYVVPNARISDPR